MRKHSKFPLVTILLAQALFFFVLALILANASPYP